MAFSSALALLGHLGETGCIRVVIFDGLGPLEHPMPFTTASKAARTFGDDAKFPLVPQRFLSKAAKTAKL